VRGAGAIRRDRLYRVFAALSPKLEADQINLVLASAGLDAEEIDYTKLVAWCVPSEAPAEAIAGASATGESEPIKVQTQTEVIKASPAPEETLALAITTGESELKEHSPTGASASNVLTADFELKINNIFQKMELNGDGTVNKRELIKSLKKDAEVADFLGLPTHIQQEDGSRDAMESFFQQVDKNGDREMDWEEFRSFFEEKAKGKGVSDASAAAAETTVQALEDGQKALEN